MAFMKLAAAAAAVAAMALLTACGGGGDSSGNADVRLVNASTGYASLDLASNGTSVSSAVAFGAAGNYTSISVGGTTQVVASGTTVGNVPTLTGGKKYSLISYGTSSPLSTMVLEEAQAAPAAGQTTLLTLNLAPDAGALDVYLTANCTDDLNNSATAATVIGSNVGGGRGSGYMSTVAGTYCVRVTGTGNKSDLRMTLPGINLPALQVATLIITPTVGGVLTNGMILVQAGGITKYAGASARTRIIASLPGNNLVSVSRGTTMLMSPSATPSVGDYTTVDSGNAAVTVTVSANNGGVPGAVIGTASVTPTLTAGGDYTLLISGSTAVPTVTPLVDDNRLPSTAGQAKVRLINGVSNLASGLNMKLDLFSVATNVAAGTASSYASVNSTTGSQLSVTTAAFTSPVLTLPSTTVPVFPLISGGVYDIIVMGDGASLATIVGDPRRVR